LIHFYKRWILNSACKWKENCSISLKVDDKIIMTGKC